jgi:hypothetical protein
MIKFNNENNGGIKLYTVNHTVLCNNDAKFRSPIDSIRIKKMIPVL